MSLGSRKLDTFKSHAHIALGKAPGTVSFPGTHAYIDAFGGSSAGPYSGGETTLVGTAETAGRFTAFHPRIHI